MVRQALTAAGVSQAELDLAASAPEFAGLAVTDKGDVDGLTKTVADFKNQHPALFASTPPPPPGGQGVRPAGGLGDAADAALKSGDIRGSISLKNQRLAQASRT